MGFCWWRFVFIIWWWKKMDLFFVNDGKPMNGERVEQDWIVASVIIISISISISSMVEKKCVTKFSIQLRLLLLLVLLQCWLCECWWWCPFRVQTLSLPSPPPAPFLHVIACCQFDWEHLLIFQSLCFVSISLSFDTQSDGNGLNVWVSEWACDCVHVCPIKMQ